MWLIEKSSDSKRIEMKQRQERGSLRGFPVSATEEIEFNVFSVIIIKKKKI